jgi:hypothetical protein
MLRRRRKCTVCGHRFTTLETVVPEGERSWVDARVVIFTAAQARGWRNAMIQMAALLEDD